MYCLAPEIASFIGDSWRDPIGSETKVTYEDQY